MTQPAAEDSVGPPRRLVRWRGLRFRSGLLRMPPAGLEPATRCLEGASRCCGLRPPLASGRPDALTRTELLRSAADYRFQSASTELVNVGKLSAVSAREPAAQRSEHQPNFGRERDVGCQADDDPERQSGHRADRDRGSDSHASQSMWRRPAPRPVRSSASGASPSDNRSISRSIRPSIMAAQPARAAIRCEPSSIVSPT